MIKFLRQVSSERLDELKYEGDYGGYIMANADPEQVVICNGDTLLAAMEQEYLWPEFLASQGIDPVAQEDQVYSPYIGA